MTILTRQDEVNKWQPYDSIKWAIETHLKETDTGEFNYGILHGNEDSPLRIQLWKEDPNWKTPCDRDWRPPTTLKLSGNMIAIPIEPPNHGTEFDDSFGL